MIALKKQESGATSALLIVGIIVLVVALVVILVVPTPSAAGIARKTDRATLDARIKAKDANRELQDADGKIQLQTWTIPEAQVAPQALARVTQLVKQRKLVLVSFRPQRKNEDGQLVHLPFLLTVDGTYPNVIALIRDLEQPAVKLAVSLTQVASADAASDRVTGNIGLVAYMPKKDAPKKPEVKRG